MELYTNQYPSWKYVSEAHEAFYKTILKRFKWSTKSNSIRSYLKDISEAHEVFYKSMKGYLILAWFIKEKQKTQMTQIMWTKQKSRYTDNCWRRKMGCQPGHPQA